MVGVKLTAEEHVIISIMMLLKITQLKMVVGHEHCGGGGGTLGMFLGGGRRVHIGR